MLPQQAAGRMLLVAWKRKQEVERAKELSVGS